MMKRANDHGSSSPTEPWSVAVVRIETATTEPGRVAPVRADTARLRSRRWLLRQIALISLLPAACCVLAACTADSNTTRSATSRPGDGLEKDPLGYNPQIEELNISGGSINNFDKNAFKKDMDDVFNP